MKPKTKISPMKLYVGNLNENIQERELKNAFREFGKVTQVEIIRDNNTGRSKGFGYIEMPDKKQAINVIKNLNGGLWDGKKITIIQAYN
jgi:RNA recognition motif-containing protein